MKRWKLFSVRSSFCMTAWLWIFKSLLQVQLFICFRSEFVLTRMGPDFPRVFSKAKYSRQKGRSSVVPFILLVFIPLLYLAYQDHLEEKESHAPALRTGPKGFHAAREAGEEMKSYFRRKRGIWKERKWERNLMMEPVSASPRKRMTREDGSWRIMSHSCTCLQNNSRIRARLVWTEPQEQSLLVSSGNSVHPEFAFSTNIISGMDDSYNSINFSTATEVRSNLSI